MGERIQATIADMHRLAETITELLETPDEIADADPFRLRLARAHALALADELASLERSPSRATLERLDFARAR